MFIKQRLAILEWAEDHENLFDDRVVLVTLFYFIGALAFGAAAWKAVVISTAVYGMTVMRIAPRPVAVIGALLLLAALARWTGLVPLMG
jgi:hypothetical protein